MNKQKKTMKNRNTEKLEPFDFRLHLLNLSNKKKKFYWLKARKPTSIKMSLKC